MPTRRGKSVGLLVLHLQIPGCRSLKEKRSRLKPLLARLHKEFNVSAAEIDDLDSWQSAQIACALVSNDSAFTQRALQAVVEWVNTHWLDLEVENDTLEIL
jgi:uncharacterized protein